MTKHMHRATGAPTRRTKIPTQRAAVLTPPVASTLGPLARQSLVEHQDAEAPAPNDTGTPITPTEAGGETAPQGEGGKGPNAPADVVEGREEEEDMPGAEIHEGKVMNWFDELGA